MRRPDSREIVLMAMYAEHMSETGDFNNVRGEALDMDSRTFIWALMRLRTEGLIDGIRWVPPGATKPEKVIALLRDKLHLTHEGLIEAEKILDVQGAQRSEKIKSAIKWFTEIGIQSIAMMLDAQIL